MTTRRRSKVVLYNPRAVFYTMPLGLVAVGSHLDPERYEVVIVERPAAGEDLEGVRGCAWQRYRFDDLSFQDTYARRVEAVADQLPTTSDLPAGSHGPPGREFVPELPAAATR